MTAHVRTLLLVWLALLALLALTVGASFLPLGALKPVVSIAIALAKAVLIFWFYMHLRELSGLVRLAALTGVVAIVILLGLISTDYLARFWLKEPGPEHGVGSGLSCASRVAFLVNACIMAEFDVAGRGLPAQR